MPRSALPSLKLVAEVCEQDAPAQSVDELVLLELEDEAVGGQGLQEAVELEGSLKRLARCRATATGSASSGYAILVPAPRRT